MIKNLKHISAIINVSYELYCISFIKCHYSPSGKQVGPESKPSDDDDDDGGECGPTCLWVLGSPCRPPGGSAPPLCVLKAQQMWEIHTVQTWFLLVGVVQNHFSLCDSKQFKKIFHTPLQHLYSDILIFKEKRMRAERIKLIYITSSHILFRRRAS